MKKIIDFKDNRGVMSLIVILGIGFFVLAIGLTLTGQIVVEMMRGRNTIAGDQSFFTAEAASREGVYQYLNDISYSGGNLQEINNIIADISIATSTWPDRYATATAVATNNLTNRVVKYIIDTYPGGDAFDKVLYSGNDLELPSDASMKKIDGAVYAENNFSKHNQLQIDCDVSTCVSTSGVEYIPLPIIDRNDLVNSATVVSDISTGLENYLNNLCSSSTDAVIFASSTVPTTLTLNINCSSPPEALEIKALIVEGDLIIEGDSQIRALVYVMGTTTIDVNGSKKVPITGALISLGNIIVDKGGTGWGSGESGIIYDKDMASFWKNLIGSATLGASTRRIIGWQQE